MSKHHTIGGKGRAAKDRPPKLQPAGQIIITCDACQAYYRTSVNVGWFDLYKPCDCGTLIHLTGRYDGYNVFPGSMTVEEVEK